MNKKLPTPTEKPLTDRERLSIVRRNLEKRNDKIIKLENYILKLEDKLIEIKMNYNLDDYTLDVLSGTE
tara:strand:- start:771 stop:977 length:207 start_codon:yes stop_codon:yes gene_type:complete